MSVTQAMIDRRRMLIATASMALAVGCSKQGESKAVPARDGKQVNDPMWTTFRQLYLDRSGRIIDNGNGGISHSEGQGYGMVLASMVGDRGAFESMAQWTQNTLGRQDVALHAWRYDPRLPSPVADWNNATDGDILIAWGLARAAALWGNNAWEQRSAQIRAAIRQRLVLERFGQHLLLPGLVGFDNGQSVTLNPSYFIWSALDLFARLDGDAAWGPVIESSETILRQSRFGPHGLPTDWIAVGPDGHPTPAPDKPPRFGFDAVRVPFYATAGRRASLVAPVADYWRAAEAGGKSPSAWIDVTTGEQAPYALSPGGMDVVKRTLNQPLDKEALAQDYYGCVLQLLCRHLT